MEKLEKEKREREREKKRKENTDKCVLYNAIFARRGRFSPVAREKCELLDAMKENSDDKAGGQLLPAGRCNRRRKMKI